jgi:hypothetical protein
LFLLAVGAMQVLALRQSVISSIRRIVLLIYPVGDRLVFLSSSISI